VSILDETLSDVERAALHELVERLRGRFGPRIVKLALFGSRARGDFHEESDIDVAVVLRDPVTPAERSEVVRLAAEIAVDAPTFVDLSPRVLSEDEHRRLLRDEWRLAEDIEREGIPL
jgi:predicted nucleotidyltransferase